MYYLSGTRTLIYVLFVRNKNNNVLIICQEQEQYFVYVFAITLSIC